MTLSEKFGFWKKKKDDTEEIGPPLDVSGDVPPPGFDSPGLDGPTVGAYKEPTPPPSLMQDPSQTHSQKDFAKDLELISAKLDAIKATLDVVVQRLDKAERGSPKW